MFDIWRRIDEKGSVVVPTKETALSALGWVEIGGFRFALDRACYIAQPSVLAKELALLNYGCNEPRKVDAAAERLTTEIAEVMDDWGLVPTRS